MIMKENKKILVVGSANTDLVISADHFPLPGETMFGHGFMTNHGGKGANQAVAAARLGGDTAFVGKVGDDQFGNSTIDMLRGEGIDVSALKVTAEAPSGVAIITTIDSGENNIVLDSGANACLTAADVREAEALFADASIVLMQLETPVEALVEAAALGKKAGAYVVLNPAPAPKKPLPEALLKKCISAMVEYEVNGIIIAPCSETPDLLEIISKNIPVILIDRYFRDSFLPYVSTNNYKGAYDAMMTLLNAGHRDILCIRGPETAVTTQERVKGCRKAVIDFGQPVRLQMLGNEFSIQNGYTETKVALIGPRVPTAIFAMSTNILLGTIKALREQNMDIPNDISVISFDDSVFLDYMNPPITRVAQPTEHMALAAVKMMINCINEGQQLQSRIFMAPTVIAKESVKIINPLVVPTDNREK